MKNIFRNTILIGILLLSAACSGIHHPQVDFLTEPQAVGGTATVFSWDFGEDSLFVQAGCRIVVKGVWDSGELSVPASRVTLPEDIPLRSFTVYRWKVEAWDAEGHKRSGRSRFRTGVYPAGNWTAGWISSAANIPVGGAQPILRREFRVGRGLRQALLAVSSTGSNLIRLGDKTVVGPYGLGTSLYGEVAGSYRVYDVTKLLSKGRNELMALVSGARPALIAELHLFYKDGSHDIICTDDRWEVASGSPYTRLANGWEYHSSEDSLAWTPARPASGYALLLPDETPLPVREKMIPLEKKQGDTLRIFDFGRQITAACSVEASGKEGEAVTFRYFDEEERPVGEDVLILGWKGRGRWTCAFSERAFRTIHASFPSGTKVKLQADIPQPVQPGWMQLRGAVEGFALDPARTPAQAPLAMTDSLYTHFGDKELLKTVYPALDESVRSVRKKNLENYTLMERFALALGEDASFWSEALHIMTGK